MFDKNFLDLPDNITNINYPKEININQNRAPTDESIKILEEMKDKIVDKLIAEKITENNFEFVALYNFPNVSLESKIRIIFLLNKKEHRIDVNYNEFQPKEEIMKNIFFEISKVIAEELFIQIDLVRGGYSKAPVKDREIIYNIDKFLTKIGF